MTILRHGVINRLSPCCFVAHSILRLIFYLLENSFPKYRPKNPIINNKMLQLQVLWAQKGWVGWNEKYVILLPSFLIWLASQSFQSGLYSRVGERSSRGCESFILWRFLELLNRYWEEISRRFEGKIYFQYSALDKLGFKMIISCLRWASTSLRPLWNKCISFLLLLTAVIGNTALPKFYFATS